MKRMFCSMAIQLTLLIFCVPGVQAAYDIFLQIPGIPGDSTDAKHAGWIDVFSAQHGIGNAGGKPTHAEFTFTKRLDKSSLPLDLAVNTGTKYTPVIIEFQKPNGTSTLVYYRVTLSNAVITGASSSSGGDTPAESISIAYTKILWEYWPVDAGGKVGTVVRSEWDLTTNTGK